eukprot:8744285-Heterocapsa_arctica.AAC.2
MASGGQVVRFDGLIIYIQLPRKADPVSNKINIVFPGNGARQPRDAEYRGGATIWVTGKQGRMERKQPIRPHWCRAAQRHEGSGARQPAVQLLPQRLHVTTWGMQHCRPAAQSCLWS